MDEHPPHTISAMVGRIAAGREPNLLTSVPSGHAVLNGNQPAAIRGCCMLVPDPVVASVNDLDTLARQQFFLDLARLGDAILAATSAERINYLILCNMVPELHAHCIPRFADEDPERRRLGPFEAYDFSAAPETDVFGPDRELHSKLVSALGGV